jgi:hypothetical protein
MFFFYFLLNVLLVSGFLGMPNRLLLWLQLPDCSVVVKLDSGTAGGVVDV